MRLNGGHFIILFFILWRNNKKKTIGKNTNIIFFKYKYDFNLTSNQKVLDVSSKFVLWLIFKSNDLWKKKIP